MSSTRIMVNINSNFIYFFLIVQIFFSHRQRAFYVPPLGTSRRDTRTPSDEYACFKQYKASRLQLNTLLVHYTKPIRSTLFDEASSVLAEHEINLKWPRRT